MKTQNDVETKTAGPVTAGLLRPPKPPEKLKAERIQELLKALPGWQLTRGGKAIRRRRGFDSPQAAASYVGFVAGAAAGAGRVLSLYLSGGTVVVTLPGHPVDGRFEELDLDLLGFAQQIG